MARTLKIDVGALQIGMYVAQLDRPWLETPFLFQGFHIRDQDDIRELKEFCQYVHVLTEDGSVTANPRLGRGAHIPPDRTSATVERRVRRGLRLPGLFRRRAAPPPASAGLVRYPRPGEFYTETESFEDELKNAAGIHDNAVVTVHSVMDNLKTSDKLDVQKLENAVTPMVSSILRNPAALSCLVRMRKKDDYLYHHSLASLVWAAILGRHIGLGQDDLAAIAMGALLLDIGKTRLPDTLLRKPGRLDSRETRLMLRHVEFGLDILREAPGIDARVVDMVAHHHERYNGSGYPAGLKGNQVPVFGRIAGVVDAYDAMITPRPYAEPMSTHEAFRQLRALADVEFQAELIDQFTQAIGVFPTGTLVELNTGEVGIVTRQNRVRRLRPQIMVVMDASKTITDSFSTLDLNSGELDAEGRQSVWIERGLAPGSFGIDPTEFFLD